jgi:hypothetical protein
MVEESHAMVALVVIAWGTLAVLVAVFLRMALRPDAGFGAAGKGRDRRHDVRPRSPPAGAPRRLGSPQAALRR